MSFRFWRSYKRANPTPRKGYVPGKVYTVVLVDAGLEYRRQFYSKRMAADYANRNRRSFSHMY